MAVKMPLLASPRMKPRTTTASRVSRLAILPTVLLALLLLKGTTEVFNFGQTSFSTQNAAPPSNSNSFVTQNASPSNTMTQQQQSRFCDGSTSDNPCVFDLGMNKGQSSAYYLRDPNARVLAVEANPVLVKRGMQRFESQLSNGRFKLVHAGISKNKGEALTFWINTWSDKFSSFLETTGCRLPGGKWPKAGDHTNCRRISVETISCADLVRIHGTPRYLKVDVEGLDRTCLQSLKDVDRQYRPRYVSKENVEGADFEFLLELGYTKFKAVNQAVLESRFVNDKSMRGTSGPWGEEAVDIFNGKRWQSYEELKSRMPLPNRAMVNGRDFHAWYDLHAAMDDEVASGDGKIEKKFCEGSSIEQPCIFDFGLNKGQSTAFYLRDYTVKVLAVEANPVLVKKAKGRFESQIEEGRFKLVHAGIAENKGETLTFWINKASDKFSSFYENVGCRYPGGKWPKQSDQTYCRRIQVNTNTCADFVRTHGTPLYLKVDIEGMDRTCLQSLTQLNRLQRPKYVSKENVMSLDFEYLNKLGYTKFKIVNQAVLESRFMGNEAMRGTSGPWGEDAEDAFIGKKWQSYEQAKNRLPLPKRAMVNGEDFAAWYDLHAAM